jgi:hypothetical protein
MFIYNIYALNCELWGTHIQIVGPPPPAVKKAAWKRYLTSLSKLQKHQDQENLNLKHYSPVLEECSTLVLRVVRRTTAGYMHCGDEGLISLRWRWGRAAFVRTAWPGELRSQEGGGLWTHLPGHVGCFSVTCFLVQLSIVVVAMFLVAKTWTTRLVVLHLPSSSVRVACGANCFVWPLLIF